MHTKRGAQDIPVAVPTPLGCYVAVARHANLGFVSGQFPIQHGRLVARGQVGRAVSAAQARRAAHIAALNVLGQILAALNGDLSRVSLLRVDGFVAATPTFTALADVLDGASETFVEVLGVRGRHARAAVAVSHLPLDAALELVVTFHVSRPFRRRRAVGSQAAA